VQLAAVRALASGTDTVIAPLLLKNWPAQSPAIRNEVIEALLRRPERLSALLDAIENRVITVNTIDQSHRQALLRKDAAIHDRAEKLLGGAPSHDRQQVIDRYRVALAKLKGDAPRGAEVFDKTCAVCHRHSPRENVGPRLGGLTDRSPDALLISMLDPNREVKAAYLNYILATKDDQEFSGIVVNETATSVTIRRAGGEEDAVLRKNIKSLNSSALSMMPEGLESLIDEQQMADLIQYLQGTRIEPG
jgi:putative heme-binding domain-containing protein